MAVEGTWEEETTVAAGSEKQFTALTRHRELAPHELAAARPAALLLPYRSFRSSPAAPHICPCQKYCISRCTNTVSAVTLPPDRAEPVTAPA